MLTLEGNIVTNTEVFRGRIEINNQGIINKIGTPTGDADFVFKDELIFPGFIDLHVHARECADHKEDYKEDFASASEAAIAGGVVAFADMPNNTTAPIDDASYAAKQKLTEKSKIEILLYAGIGKNTTPLSRKVPYKVFMGPSIGDLFFSSREALEIAIAKYHGHKVSFHCEDPKIMDAHKDAETHEARRPKEAEISAVDFALRLMEKYNIEGKICHCSTMEGIEKIVKAKNKGTKVTVEVTPHHLYFSADAKALADKDERTMLQVNPPIRQTEENRLGLIEFFKQGKIDYLATDHAPHIEEEKKKGISGLAHLDTYGPFVSWLLKEHGIKPEQIARVCSSNPATFFSEFTRNNYGAIKEGYTASLTVIDLNKPYLVEKEKLKTKSKHSPFMGLTFPGRVVMTIVDGEILKNEIE